ncbi:MAG TPA: hypothetical protein VHM02_02065 [Thermoanaerobaculia bacterium]|nr:hypothetical protein [Thermoanaerobaculia bacterium]
MEKLDPAPFFTRPFLDLLRGEARALGRPVDLLWVIAGLALGWWLYVPVHELLHAAGCLLAGGEVHRLEIDPLYGGALLARVFPFVAAGGQYAGRLSGFDTGGSDWVYLATDLAPFVLTLFPGVWLLRLAGRRRAAFLFAAAAPFALAPFLSLGGDAYEIGALVVTEMAPWRGAEHRALVADDLPRLALAVGRGGAPLPDGGATWAGLALGAVFGAIWAFAVYALGSLVATAFGQRPLRAAASGSYRAPAGAAGRAAR